MRSGTPLDMLADTVAVCSQVARGLSELRNPILSVSETTGYIKRLLERDELLSEIMVRGEVSNLRRPSSGHMYFSLKDERNILPAVCFRGVAGSLSFEPENGMSVVAGGNCTIYEPQGSYQLIVRFMRRDGVGELAAAYQKLQAKLEEEGLFAEDRKRVLPRFPKAIGLVTSSGSAAARDMILILGQRYPLARIKLIPTVVQGETGASSIVRSLRVAGSADVDLIILGRGGGSLEDLWCFNEEAVAREVFASRVPVISAVGHETDYVLTDFVADARAATPSHAAEMAVPDADELAGYVETLQDRASGKLQAIMQERGARLRQVMSYPALQRPQLLVETKLQRLDDAQRALAARSAEAGKIRRERLEAATSRLAGIDRRAVRRRGYAIRSEYVAGLRKRLEGAMSHPLLQRPELIAGGKRERLDHVQQMVRLHGRQFGKSDRSRLERLNARLEGLAPEAALRRGYSIVRRTEDGSLVTSVRCVARGDGLTIAVTDGDISADVGDVKPGG